MGAYIQSLKCRVALLYNEVTCEMRSEGIIAIATTINHYQQSLNSSLSSPQFILRDFACEHYDDIESERRSRAHMKTRWEAEIIEDRSDHEEEDNGSEDDPNEGHLRRTGPTFCFVVLHHTNRPTDDNGNWQSWKTDNNDPCNRCNRCNKCKWRTARTGFSVLIINQFLIMWDLRLHRAIDQSSWTVHPL